MKSKNQEKVVFIVSMKSILKGESGQQFQMLITVALGGVWELTDKFVSVDAPGDTANSK